MDESTQAPQIPCCQCGTIMHVYLQLGVDEDEAAYFVTCVNAACLMWGQTLSASHYPPENLEVYLNPYESQGVVLVYIGLVRQDSEEAAAAIEQIQYTVGSQAALRAALIITIFRMEVKENHWIPDIGVYAYLIQDYPQAIPLLEHAMGCCLQSWGIHNLEPVHLKMTDPAHSDAKARTSTPHH